jgi:hypothetical protein
MVAIADQGADHAREVEGLLGVEDHARGPQLQDDVAGRVEPDLKLLIIHPSAPLRFAVGSRQ